MKCLGSKKKKENALLITTLDRKPAWDAANRAWAPARDDALNSASPLGGARSNPKLCVTVLPECRDCKILTSEFGRHLERSEYNFYYRSISVRRQDSGKLVTFQNIFFQTFVDKISKIRDFIRSGVHQTKVKKKQWKWNVGKSPPAATVWRRK